MAYKFTPEDKEDVNPQFEDRIPFGVTPVQITLATADVTDNGSDFVEVGVIAENGAEATTRLYFTEKAAKYSLSTIKAVATHNAPDDKKDAARAAIDAVKDTDFLAQLINDKMIGNKAWFTKYYDPERTYQDRDGNTRQSINTGLWGFEPKLREDLMPKPKNDSINPADYPDDDVKGEPFPSSGIPKAW